MELLRPTGETVGHVSIHPDWEPAIECARLTGLRTHGVWAPESSATRAIDPLWHERRGAPFTRGFRVHLAAPSGASWHEDVSVVYLADLARQASTSMVEKGALAEGDHYLYRVLAYVQQDAAPSDRDPAGSFTIRDQSPPLPLKTVPPGSLQGESAPGDDDCAGDIEVFLARAVLDEASALTASAGDVETGGILIGHLTRESGRSDVAVEITALVPARHTIGTSVKLTFTSDTWTDVRGAVTLRARNELVLGWFHSHPQQAWCRDKGCSPERQRECPNAAGFFSSDDAALHRTMFPRAFTVALVMTHSGRGILPRLFGWRHGRLTARGFRVSALPISTGDIVDATSTIA